MDQPPNGYGYTWHYFGNYYDADINSPSFDHCMAWQSGNVVNTTLKSDIPAMWRRWVCPLGTTVAESHWDYAAQYWIPTSCNARCPANSQPSGSTCTCNDPYVPDATGTSCVPVPAVACPVGKLTTPPFPGDVDPACTASLEKGKGVDVNNACGTLRKPDMVEAASCIAAKIKALNIPYTQPSATIRTAAYQNHLLEIWDKSQRLDTIMNSIVYTSETKQACAPRYTEVNNEKAQHGITHQPSSSGDAAPHVEQRAIDVPEAVSDALMDQVTTYTTTVTTVNGQDEFTKTIASDVEDYMHSAPNACNPNLSWGGRFDSHDWVHFQLP